MLLSHRSQAVKTSRFSAARAPMNTCGILRGFGNVVCSCNFVICTVKYTHTCALGMGFKLAVVYMMCKSCVLHLHSLKFYILSEISVNICQIYLHDPVYMF
jgi:hypothetical protein